MKIREIEEFREMKGERTVEERNILEEIKEQCREDAAIADIGSEQYNNMIDCIIKLERLEMDKERLKLEEKKVKDQKKKDIIDISLKHGITLGLGIGTILTSVMVVAQSMIFEETHTLTNPIVRMFMTKNLFKLPTK